MQFEKRFTIRDIREGYLVELGSTEGTIWRLFMTYNNVYGNYKMNIFRSRDIGAVTIDVRMGDQGYNELCINGFLLSDGVDSAVFSLQNCVQSRAVAGYVTVHYNSMSSLASKVEAVTQTENGIISSIAEETSPQLVNDFLNILDNPDSFSDATCVCGGSKIPVHRNILSARSPVFAAMFKTQMQEGRDGVVDIVDMETDVLMAMLRYVYGGKTDHLTCSMAGDLLCAADKYQLEELKLICVEKLKEGMVKNNVFFFLVLGDLYDKSLKAHAIEFICKYKKFSDLEKEEEWRSLMKERTSLALEVTTTVIKYLQNKCDCTENLP